MIIAMFIIATFAVPFSASAISSNLIDTTRQGNLVVNKYEMEDITQATNPGTGEASDSTNLPESAKGLAGVTFKITKVAEVTSAYYTVAGTQLPTPAQAKTMPAIGTPITKTTNSEGKAEFNNIPLGLYLVEETDAPPQVTTKTSDFMVSIPDTGTDGEHWRYTVSVFPKNETTYKPITIKKVDGATNTALQNAVFTLEKSKDNSTWTSVETDLTTNENGIVSPTKALGVNTYYKLTETQAPSKYILDKVKKVSYFYLDVNGNICDSTTKAIIDTQNPSQLTVENTKPTIEKFIDTSRGNGTGLVKSDSIVRYNDSNNYQYYVVKVHTPDVTEMNSLKTFTVNDQFSNISSSEAPTVTKVTSGSATGSAINTNAYTYTSTKDETINTTYNSKLVFDTTKISTNTDYYIFYKGYVTDSVTNTAELKYSVVTEGADVTDTENSDEVEFFKRGYMFNKTDEKDHPLTGAKFKIYASEEDANNARNPIYAINGATNTLVNEFTTDSHGVVTISDIDVGTDKTASRTYWLVETKAPSGYSLLAKPFEITVTPTSLSTSQMSVVNTRNFVLPTTGGQGYYMYLLLGAILLAFGLGIGTFAFNYKATRKNNR